MHRQPQGVAVAVEVDAVGRDPVYELAAVELARLQGRELGQELGLLRLVGLVGALGHQAAELLGAGHVAVGERPFEALEAVVEEQPRIGEVPVGARYGSSPERVVFELGLVLDVALHRGHGLDLQRVFRGEGDGARLVACAPEDELGDGPEGNWLGAFRIVDRHAQGAAAQVGRGQHLLEDLQRGEGARVLEGQQVAVVDQVQVQHPGRQGRVVVVEPDDDLLVVLGHELEVEGGAALAAAAV